MGCSYIHYTLKNGTVRFIFDLRELNEQLKRKPYPIPKNAQMLQELEEFASATSLNLNMGYYTIKLDTKDFQWGYPAHQTFPKKRCLTYHPW
jgi:hypothetical protein